MENNMKTLKQVQNGMGKIWHGLIKKKVNVRLNKPINFHQAGESMSS